MAKNDKRVPCSTDNCDRTVSENSTSGKCTACQSAKSYWKKASPARVLLRRGKLALYSHRLVEWFDKDGRVKK